MIAPTRSSLVSSQTEQLLASRPEPGIPRPRPFYVALFLLPCTAAFGSLLPGLGPIFGFRVLVLVVLTYSALGMRRRITDTRTGALLAILITTWACFAGVGAIIVDTGTSSQRALAELLTGLTLICCLASSTKPFKALRVLSHGWTLAFLVTGALAVREVLTGAHLPNYFPSTDLARIDPRLVASTFGNPNNYAAFLVTVFPFLASSLLAAKRQKSKWAYGSMVVLLFGLMLATGSRLCIIALLVEGALMICLGFHALRKGAMAAASALLVSALVVFAVGGSSAFASMAAALPGKLETFSPTQLIDESTSGGSTSSGERRVNLYLDGLWMVGRSGGVGVGPGNFEVTMDSPVVPYYAGGVLSPHNLYLEMASQYGLLVFTAFAVLAVVIFRNCWRPTWAARTARAKLPSPPPVPAVCAFTFLVAMVGNSVSAFASSSYLTGSINWVFAGALVLLSIELDRGSSSTSRSSSLGRISRRASRAVLGVVPSRRGSKDWEGAMCRVADV